MFGDIIKYRYYFLILKSKVMAIDAFGANSKGMGSNKALKADNSNKSAKKARKKRQRQENKKIIEEAIPPTPRET